jgi:hypothetical protein
MSEPVSEASMNNLFRSFELVEELANLVKKVNFLVSLRYKASENRVNQTVDLISGHTPLFKDIAIQVVLYLQQDIFEQELIFDTRMVLNMYIALKKLNMKLISQNYYMLNDYFFITGVNQLVTTDMDRNMKISKCILQSMRRLKVLKEKHGWFAMCVHMDQVEKMARDANQTFFFISNFFQFVATKKCEYANGQ